MGATLHTVDLSSGRVHRRYRDEEASGRLLVDERCNLDDAGSFRAIEVAEVEQIRQLSPERLCKLCYGNFDDGRLAEHPEK